MKEQQGSNRISPGIIAAMTAAVIAVAGSVTFLPQNLTRIPLHKFRLQQKLNLSNQQTSLVLSEMLKSFGCKILVMGLNWFLKSFKSRLLGIHRTKF